MAEIRLSKLIKQFNIGLDTLVDFMNSLGANIKDANPNMKVSDEYLPDLERRFSKDRKLGESADKVEVRASNIIEGVKPKLPASVAPEAFDWDAFENDGAVTSRKEETLADYEQRLSKVVENEVVEGIVTSINRREVVVNIGATSEGVISAPEFRYNPDLKVGDKVDVLVENVEDRKGQLIISHKKARQLKSWDMVNAAYESGEIVKGYVKSRTKGGMIVDVFGIEAFLPGSQIDIKPVRDYDVFVDTTMELKIVKLNQEFKNVVVSHKALLEAEQEQKRSEIISTLEKGQIIDGVVSRITNYGAFVDLGGIDGLIHKTNLSWSPFEHPSEVVSEGQILKVLVLEIKDDHHIDLGLKQLTDQPKESTPTIIKATTKEDYPSEIDPESFFSEKALNILKNRNQE